MTNAETVSRPWYREPWPWLLMAGPAAVVVAGAITAVLAVTSFDGLVSDDYYKQGLAVNREISREAAARALGISATLQFSPDHTRVRVILAGADAAPVLTIVHPTIPGEDQRVRLVRLATNVFEGSIHPPPGRRVGLRLEDGQGRWRLRGDWLLEDGSARLAPH